MRQVPASRWANVDQSVLENAVINRVVVPPNTRLMICVARTFKAIC